MNFPFMIFGASLSRVESIWKKFYEIGRKKGDCFQGEMSLLINQSSTIGEAKCNSRRGDFFVVPLSSCKAEVPFHDSDVIMEYEMYYLSSSDSRG